MLITQSLTYNGCKGQLYMGRQDLGLVTQLGKKIFKKDN